MAIRKKREEQLQRMEADMKINRKEKRSREDKRLEKKEKERRKKEKQKLPIHLMENISIQHLLLFR